MNLRRCRVGGDVTHAYAQVHARIRMYHRWDLFHEFSILVEIGNGQGAGRTRAVLPDAFCLAHARDSHGKFSDVCITEGSGISNCVKSSNKLHTFNSVNY